MSNFPPTPYPDVSIDAKRQIRLIIMLPGKRGEKFRCILKVHTLELAEDGIPKPINLRSAHPRRSHSGTGQYTALSYCWGGFEDYGTIYLNDIPNYPVSRNLYNALHRIRDNTSSWPSLWIDQICINQHDLAERNQQVSIFQHIYNQAERVSIWVGDNDAERPPKGRFFKDARTSKQLEAALEMAKGQWWTRAWVVQECILAQSEPSILFGPCEVDFEQLAAIVKPTGSVLAHGPFAMPRGQELLSAIRAFLDLRGSGSAKTAQMHVMAFILSQTEATNPRDKVYSLRGVMEEMESLIPNYNRTVQHIFCEATSLLINSTGSLAMLGLAYLSKFSDSELPSWAVDFAFESLNTYRKMSMDALDEYSPGTGYRILDKAGRKLIAGMVNFITIQGPAELSKFIFDQTPVPWTRKQPQVSAESRHSPAEHSLTIRALRFEVIMTITPLSGLDTITTRDYQPDLYHQEMLWSSDSPYELLSQTLDTSEGRMRQLKRITQDYFSVLQEHGGLDSEQAMQENIHGTRQHPAAVAYSTLRAWEVRLGAALYGSTQPDPEYPLINIPAMSALWSKCFVEKKRRENKTLWFPPMDHPARGSLHDLERWYRYLCQMPKDFPPAAPEDHANPSFEPGFPPLISFNTAAGFCGVGGPLMMPRDIIVLPYGSRSPMVVRAAGDGKWRFVCFAYVIGIMDQELYDVFPDIELKEEDFRLV